MMKRIPFVIRKPITLEELREPIFIEDQSWYPIPRFEGIYEMNLYGMVRRFSTKEQLVQYPTRRGDYIVILRHPNGDGSSLCCTITDLWTTTFYGDNALFEYSYLDSIKRTPNR